MLFQITLLTCFMFAVIYPLIFWISFRDPLKETFHRFHLATPTIIGVVTLIFILRADFPPDVKTLASVSMGLLFLLTFYCWNRDYPNVFAVTVPCLVGIFAFIKLQGYLIDYSWEVAFIGILSGCIFCASLFSMNLGHWYLNVKGLPIKHLMNATYVFWFFVAVRFLWNIYYLFLHKMTYGGDQIPVFSFLTKLDGFLLLIGLFFGTLFPLVSLFFAHGTLKLKNTQATTGILYVILCAVLIGDLTYKYYLIKFGIAL